MTRRSTRRSYISAIISILLSGGLLISSPAFASGTGDSSLKEKTRGSVWAGFNEMAGNAAQSNDDNGHLENQSEADGPTTVGASDSVAQNSSAAASATVMIYLNGSDLESASGAASLDISEMLHAGCGENVNVVLETLGTKEWQDHGISSETAQRWRINGSELELVQDHLGQLDATSQETLTDFISWAASSYPADRYILLMWDHGGGAVYGYGYDEWQDKEASLTMDEISAALEENADIHFDFIGMDACLMSSLEVCLILAPYCNYTILSEDFESNIGWYYTDWLKALEENPGIGSVELGKVIVDTMLAANKADTFRGGDATLAVIDESKVEDLFVAWTTFAYANEDLLLGSNYSTKRRSKGRVLPQIAKGSEKQLPDQVDKLRSLSDRYDGGFSYEDGNNEHYSEYYVTDIMAVASNTTGEGTAQLENAVSNAIAYMDSSSSETLTGIGVTLPYGDNYFYEELQKIFSNCALDSAYIEWLQKFVYANGSGSYYDYDEWYESWGGWSSWYAQIAGSSQAQSSEEDGCYDDYYDDSYDEGYYDDIPYDSNDEDYYGDSAFDENYCDDSSQDSQDEGCYDNSCSTGAGWYDSLYGSYGADGESYDEWYEDWAEEWEDCYG